MDNSLIMLQRCFFALTFVGLFYISSPSFGGREAVSTDQPAILYADVLQVDNERGLILAQGNVKVFHEARGLTADTVTYNRQTDIVTASGNVQLTEPTGEISFSNYAELSGDLKTGIVQEIRMILSDDAKFAASIGERRDENTVILRQAVYSRCQVCREDPESAPLWQVKSRKVLWDREAQEIIHHDAWIEMFGVPILYTPYLSHPDPKVKRRSGFLAPYYGGSSATGAEGIFIIPYFLVISDDKDITLKPLFTTNAGSFMGAKYRQRMSNSAIWVAGSAGAGPRVIEEDARERIRTSKTKKSDEDLTDKFRGHIDGKVRGNLTSDWRWGLDLVRASDKSYMRQFPYNGYVSDSFLTSNIFAEGFYGRNYLLAQGYSFQGLREVDRQKKTPLIFPQLDINYLSRPQGFGYRWSLDANTMILSRKEGTDVRRLSLTGGWQFPYTTSRGDIFTLNALVRGDGYSIADFMREDRPEKKEGENTRRGRFFPQASLDWRFPFIRPGEEHHVTIEPVVSVIGAPKLGGQERIPNEDSLILEPTDYSMLDSNRFPGLDRIDDGSRVNFGIQTKTYHSKLMSTGLFFGQTYNIQHPGEIFKNTGFEDHWSDYLGRASIDIEPYLHLRYRFRLDRSSGNLKRNEFNIMAGDSFLKLNLNYLILPKIPTEELTKTGRQLWINLSSEFIKNWTVNTGMIREIGGQDSSLAHTFGFSYDNECFRFETLISKTFYKNVEIKPGVSGMFRIVLKTLGEVHYSTVLSQKPQPGTKKDKGSGPFGKFISF